ncbi:hypothetical protein [Paraburkholderia sp. BL18I3N2]|uniref:hypothetical protein n=1 Tax=Paraburkholderia sp. BL18I3N2 TaxID=1938799 RepID=UPI000D05F311|nr:hypothetical protein [Paraburkholderia sp. BL18I3N2]
MTEVGRGNCGNPCGIEAALFEQQATSNKRVANRHRATNKNGALKGRRFHNQFQQSACNECPRPPMPYFST